MVELAIIGSDMQEVIGCAIALNLLSVGRYFLSRLSMKSYRKHFYRFTILLIEMLIFFSSLLQDSTVGRSPHHHHRHICVPLSRQIRYGYTITYLSVNL